MKVRATQTGFLGRFHSPGEKPFDVPEELFSETWMEPAEGEEDALADADLDGIPDDWESLPWFSLRKLVKEATGKQPKDKDEAIAFMREAGLVPQDEERGQ